MKSLILTSLVFVMNLAAAADSHYIDEDPAPAQAAAPKAAPAPKVAPAVMDDSAPADVPAAAVTPAPKQQVVKPKAMDESAATAQPEAARKPASKDIDDEQKRMNEAAAAKDERGVVEAATHILGVDSKNLRALNALAVYYYNQGKFGLSRLILLRALKDYPDNASIENNLGMIALAEGKQKSAIGSFRHAMEIKTSYVPAACNLGAIYLENKDYKKAADVLKVGYEAYRSDLKRSGGYGLEVANNYAVALSGAGNLDEANNVFKKIMRVDDSNPSLVYNYAVLLVARMKNKREGERLIAKLKLIADSGLDKKVSELEKYLNDSGKVPESKQDSKEESKPDTKDEE